MSAAMAMSPAMVSFRTPVLPWAIAADDELRFKRITQRVLIVCVLFCLALPWLPVTRRKRRSSSAETDHENTDGRNETIDIDDIEAAAALMTRTSAAPRTTRR